LSRPITIKIKRLNARVPLPVKMTPQAAGFDLHAAVGSPTTIKRNQIRLIPCGFSMAIPEGYEAQVRPRSGLASKHGITLINSPGTIDSDYRGEVQVPLINLGGKAFAIQPGMRIAQMLVAPVPRVVLKEVAELEETKRGRGGFGHTGH
jgi:dUTP pyrophosphatase